LIRKSWHAVSNIVDLQEVSMLNVYQWEFFNRRWCTAKIALVSSIPISVL